MTRDPAGREATLEHARASARAACAAVSTATAERPQAEPASAGGEAGADGDAAEADRVADGEMAGAGAGESGVAAEAGAGESGEMAGESGEVAEAGAGESGVAAEAGAVAAKAAAENFPVALRTLPRRYREHLMAVYVYARTVDDAGDEGPRAERQQRLAELAADLDRLYRDGGNDVTRLHPAVAGLVGVVRDCQIPAQPFRDLIGANEQDQVVSRYQTFEELLGYCTLSANPVGQFVLYIFGCATPARQRLSDSICSGLQVIEHLQDVAEDYQAGRIYLPAADMRAFGVPEQDLAGSVATPQLRRLVAAEASRAAELLDSGAPLIGQLRGAARVAVAGYLAGGRAALAALAAVNYDVLTSTPKPGKTRTLRELAAALVRGR